MGTAANAATPPPIVGGSETSAHPAVVALIAYNEARGGAVFCSGTAIAPTWVLTAAHCLEAAEQYDEGGFSLYVAVGDDLYQASGIDEAVPAEATFIHPEYGGIDTLPPVWDVGLIELERELEAADPLVVNGAPPDGAWRGDDLDLVGWGVTTDGAQDAGLKRTVTVPYETHDAQFIYVWSPGTNVCQGDSGGAMLRRTDDGLRLVGVHSFVFSGSASVPPCAEGGSAATRTDQIVDFLADHMDVSERDGVVSIDGYDREGSSGLPTETRSSCQAAPGALAPTSGLLALLAAGAGGLRRRR